MKNNKLAKFKKLKRLKKKYKIILACILAVIIGVIVFAVIHTVRTPQLEEDTTIAEAVSMTIENTLESDGKITSSLEEEVLPHTGYYLESIDVEVGQALEEGDKILTYTNGATFIAPYNCVVTSWDLPDEEEQLTSEHYVAISGTDVMQMEISVNEDQVAKVEVGEIATVKVDATNSSYASEVSYVSEVGSYSGGNSSFTARLTFANDGNLKIGMSATAVVSLERAENVIAVPVNAVSSIADESYVTVVDGGNKNQVTVETGISNDSYIEIKSGLKAGEQVVVRVSSDSNNEKMKGEFDRGPGGFGGDPGNFGGGERGGEMQNRQAPN